MGREGRVPFQRLVVLAATVFALVLPHMAVADPGPTKPDLTAHHAPDRVIVKFEKGSAGFAAKRASGRAGIGALRAMPRLGVFHHWRVD